MPNVEPVSASFLRALFVGQLSGFHDRDHWLKAVEGIVVTPAIGDEPNWTVRTNAREPDVFEIEVLAEALRTRYPFARND